MVLKVELYAACNYNPQKIRRRSEIHQLMRKVELNMKAVVAALTLLAVMVILIEGKPLSIREKGRGVQRRLEKLKKNLSAKTVSKCAHQCLVTALQVWSVLSALPQNLLNSLTSYQLSH